MIRLKIRSVAADWILTLRPEETFLYFTVSFWDAPERRFISARYAERRRREDGGTLRAEHSSPVPLVPPPTGGDITVDESWGQTRSPAAAEGQKKERKKLLLCLYPHLIMFHPGRVKLPPSVAWGGVWYFLNAAKTPGTCLMCSCIHIFVVHKQQTLRAEICCCCCHLCLS